MSWFGLGDALAEVDNAHPGCRGTGAAFHNALRTQRLTLRSARGDLMDPISDPLPSLQFVFAVWRPPTPPIPDDDSLLADTDAGESRPMEMGDSTGSTHAPEAPLQAPVPPPGSDASAAPSGNPPASKATLCVPTPLGRRLLRNGKQPEPHNAAPQAPAAAGERPPAKQAEVGSLQTLLDDYELLTSPGAISLRNDIAKVPGMPRGLRTLGALAPGHPGLCRAFHIFTDGPFDPGPKLHRGGWAFNVFVQQDDPRQPLAFLGYACGSMRPWVSSTLAIDYSSYDAEAVSILVAAVWALSLPGDRQVHFHVDSQSVLGAANQAANPDSSNTAACLARQAVQILEAKERNMHWHWVPGHKGIAGNEISDSLSKAAALGVWPDTPLPHALWQAVTHPLFGWLWRASTAKTDCPPLASLERGRYEAPDQVPPALLSEGQGPEAPKVTTIALQACTLNVQSLLDQKDALWHLLGKERFGIVGLQETRIQHDYQCKGRAFFEVHAAGKNGNHGTSLLFAKDVPYYGWQGDRPLHILPEHVSCLHAEPSILVCAVHAPGLHLCCVSAHAPHSGNSPSGIQAWWRKLQGVIPIDAKGRLLLLVDANARLGSVTSAGIDAHAGEEECVAGECLRELADVFQLWIPATCFDRKGRRDPSASEPTWVSPHGTLHRIDYIGVPQAWNTGNVTPWVHRDLLPARQHEDHWAACVSAQFVTHCTATKKGPGVLPRDPSRATEQCRQAVLAAWDTAPLVPWEANVHEHMDLLQNTIAQAAQSTPPPPMCKKRPFVSEEAAALLHDCKRLRRSLRGFDRLERQLRLRTILHAWSRGRARPPVSREGWTLRDLQAIKGVFVRWLHADRTAVRTTIQADKAAFAASRLRSLQEAGQAGNAKAFYKALAPLRPPGKKILKPFAPLVITRGEGNQMPDPIALVKDKREHFAALEAGEETTLAELFSEAPAQSTLDGTFELRELPTLTQIEHLVRSIQLGKAPGPSTVPGWVWKSNTTKAARALLPLFLKAHVRLTEPIQSKATDLISLFKGKGSARDWCNHRAICLLEEPGKLLRKASRAALLGALQAKELHQGGMPGSLLPSGHHLLRTFFATARAQRSAHAALFFDVTSAYYRVVRECFFKAPDCDEAFLTVLRRLEVPAEYLHEVVCWARGAALLEHMSPHGQRVIKTFMSNTHFKMRGDGVYVGTHAGVRPGDTIADVLFAFVQADLVKAIEQAAAREGLLECPVREAASLPLSLLCPTWADDSAILLADRSSERLLQRARCLFQIAHREMMRRAMAPNYKAGKTEAVVHLSGKGKRELARELFVRQQSRLHFTVGQRTFAVGCVPGYSHLGGRVTVKGNAIADLRQKLASAFAAAKPLARTVLRNKHLPIAQRRQLLSGLSLSRITHTAATWPRLGGRGECPLVCGLLTARPTSDKR